MSKDYKSVAIIIDDFSASSLNYAGVNFYNYSGNQFIQVSSLSESGYLHGDWVVEAFYDQLDANSDCEVILIDIDIDFLVDNVDLTQLDLIFSSTGWGFRTTALIENLLDGWLLQNNTTDVEYIPISLSYSLAGYTPDFSERRALEYLMDNAIALVQASTNVTHRGVNWANTFSDVISVGAYNIDINNDFMYSYPTNEPFIDILANGDRSNNLGSAFGTSYATPRVSAEIVNLMSAYLQQVNALLNTNQLSVLDLEGYQYNGVNPIGLITNILLEVGAIDQSDLNVYGILSYTDYINFLLTSISTDIYIETIEGWQETPVQVLSDDVALNSSPVLVKNTDIGLDDYEIINTAYQAPNTNSAPVALNDSVVFYEGYFIVIDVLSNDSDIDNDIIFLNSAYAEYGNVSIVENQLYYQPPANFNGNDSISYSISDGELIDWATVNIAIDLVNNIPVANEDTASTDEDMAVIIDVLTNDTDTDGDILSVDSASAINGTVAVNVDGTLLYIGNQDFNGIDTIVYTVSDGNGGFDTASVIVDVLPIDDNLSAQLIQVRNIETMTKAQASINEHGTDYTGADTAKVMKFELWLDASELSSFAAESTEIRGYQFDIDWVTDSEVELLNWVVTSGDYLGFNPTNSANSAITINSITGTIAFASSTAIVDIDINNDGYPSLLGTEKLIATLYINPIDGLKVVNLSMKDMLIVTDVGNIVPENYSTEMKVLSADATIQIDMNNYLDNIVLNYFKDGVDTSVSTLVESGSISFDQALEFDAVKLSNPSAYNITIQADDAVAILRHIVALDSLTVGSVAWHAADVNNNELIQTDDAVAVLKHIVALDTLDTFDLVDNTTGNRVTSLDPDTTLGQWTIVVNGDVDLSSSFDDQYLIPVDFI